MLRSYESYACPSGQNDQDPHRTQATAPASRFDRDQTPPLVIGLVVGHMGEGHEPLDRSSKRISASRKLDGQAPLRAELRCNGTLQPQHPALAFSAAWRQV